MAPRLTNTPPSWRRRQWRAHHRHRPSLLLRRNGQSATPQAHSSQYLLPRRRAPTQPPMTVPLCLRVCRVEHAARPQLPKHWHAATSQGSEVKSLGTGTPASRSGSAETLDPPLGRPWRCSGSPGEAAALLLPWRRSGDTQDPSAPDRLLLGPRRGSAEDPTMGAGSTSKNGCCKASAAVNREPGSHISRRKMRSMAGWPSGRGRTTSRNANFSLGGWRLWLAVR